MQDSEIVLDAICRITGVSKTKILSRSRLWPIVEARMLFVLFFARLGQNDQMTAFMLDRDRTTILNARHKAEDYIGISKSFLDKFNKLKEIYEVTKSVRLP